MNNNYLYAYSFIHSGYLYSAPSRNLLRGILSPATARKKCLKKLAEGRHIVLGSKPILTRRPGVRKRAHPFTLPLKDDKQCIPVSYIAPCFLLSSPRFVFPIGFSIYLTLFPQQLSQSRSLFI